jgi:hypothetical protein
METHSRPICVYKPKSNTLLKLLISQTFSIGPSVSNFLLVRSPPVFSCKMDAADHLNFSYCLPSYDFSSIQHHSLPLVPGSPMSWFKVKVLGRGSYGTVPLAISTSTTGSSSSGFFAVKSAVVEHFDSLMKEIEILKEFINCPKIVRGLGFELTSGV